MACDKGYKGDCCCECEYQLKIYICDCGKCPIVKGYICTLYHNLDHNYLCRYYPQKHGACECFILRKNISKKGKGQELLIKEDIFNSKDK